MAEHLETFLKALESSIQDGVFVKLTVGSPRDSDSSLKKILIKPVLLANEEHLSFVYRHKTKDVTKNLPIAQGLSLVATLLGPDFLSANLFTTINDIELTFSRDPKGSAPIRMRLSKPTHKTAPAKHHNRPKKRLIASQGNPYLALLGVTHKDGAVKKGMEPKYRQINKFIEIIDGLIQSSSLKNAGAISVLDMGSGKGYLTFAIYDYLTATLKKRATVTGVEVRKDLVDLCSSVAKAVGFIGLSFTAGSIQDYRPGPTDVLIALHACDTATDQALFQAIEARASLILCAPCCHKELRPQMHCAVPGLERTLQFGILQERQAELITDGLRALLLEALGYKTSVFEFIATEHTSKNTMIVGMKTPKNPDQKAVLSQIDALKKAFGIRTQQLETLLMTTNRVAAH